MLTDLSLDPAADHADDVLDLRCIERDVLLDAVILAQARSAACSRGVLRDEDRMTSIRRLPAVIDGLHRC
jgi:hypothetical protein